MLNEILNRAVRWTGSVALLVAFTAPAWAGSTVASFTGQVEIDPMPGSLVPGQDDNSLAAMLFMERSDLSFASGFTVDATQAGTYSSRASLTPGVIAAGAVISDTYFHSDPGVTPNGTRFTGSITFSNIILGVIAQTSTLNLSDGVLGQQGVTYANTFPARGFELTPGQDQFTISSDLHTLSFSVLTWGMEDDMRVITAGSLLQSGLQTAPEPGSFFLLGLALAAFGIYGKKFRRN